MLIDARKVAPGATIDTDLCIIGAGAAGIAIAREFREGPTRICLLESGGLEADEDTQRLYVGVTIGRRYFRLRNSRTRYFGGSTNCWMGICRPLDVDDFEARDWIPYSGWPFDRSALMPWYERAQQVCRLGPFRYEGDEITSPKLPQLPLAGSDVVTRCFHVAPTRFGEVYRDEIASAADIDTYLHANVVEIEPGEGVRAVERIHVKTLAGNEFRVRPRFVVLATGGIENARLLFVSRRVQQAGLGNQNDLVGRFFMEHPHTVAGEFLFSGASPLGLYRQHRRGDVNVLGLLTLSAAARRRERLANFTVTLGVDARSLEPFERDLASAAAGFDSPLPASNAIASKFALSNECEQIPNPESRIKLSHDRDALGMNRVTLTWRLTPEDKQSFRRSHEILARALARSGIGRMKLAPQLVAEDDSWPADLNGGRHHMGTTRMNPDPGLGVVDADCRVHGLANLYIAGSSVFPTSGSANPTLTIVALALRLADHLKARLA